MKLVPGDGLELSRPELDAGIFYQNLQNPDCIQLDVT